MSRKIFLAGIISGTVMAMLEMMYEGIWGIGFWAPPVTIAATVLRDLQTIAVPISTFLFIPVMLGIMMHMVNSVIFDNIFNRIVSLYTASATKRILFEAVFGMVIFMIMWFLVLPIVNPVMLKLNGVVFVMAHAIWGAILGFMAKPKMRQVLA